MGRKVPSRGRCICTHAPRWLESFIFVRVYKGFLITVRFLGSYFFLEGRNTRNFHCFCKIPGGLFFLEVCVEVPISAAPGMLYVQGNIHKPYSEFHVQIVIF